MLALCYQYHNSAWCALSLFGAFLTQTVSLNSSVSVELCICYKVVGSSAKHQPTVTEMSKLEAEINFLKRSLDVSESDIF